MKEETKRRWNVLASAIKNKQVLKNSDFENGSLIQTDLDQKNQVFIDLEKWGLNVNVNLIDQNNNDTSLLRSNKNITVPNNDQIQNNIIRLSIYPPNITYNNEILTGFNNTGNVKIWPAEQVLTRFVFGCLLENPNTCSSLFASDAHCELRKLLNLTLSLSSQKSSPINLNFLELGGGYSSLASLFLAKFIKLNKNQIKLSDELSTKNTKIYNNYTFHVTDGNQTSISHCQKLIKLNNLENIVSASLLRWDDPSTYITNINFNYLLIADCFFFDDFREPLKNTVLYYFEKNPDLKVVCMAPSRSGTFERFLGLFDEERVQCTTPVLWPEDDSQIYLSILFIK